MKEKFKIALAQISCCPGDKKANLQKIWEYAKKAKEQGADLVVFPELSLTGYTVRDDIYELAEKIPGPSTIVIEELARELEVHVIFGMPELSEKAEATIYNSAVLVSPEGLIGKYRKIQLPNHSVFEEKRYFRPGHNSGVFETKLGKIGLIICYDIFFPELSRLARLEGAKLIVCISASPTVRRKFFETLTVARAIENSAYLAYVNLVGMENGLQFWGGSRLIGPDGDIIARAVYDEENIVFGEVDYTSLRPLEVFTPTLKDLRPELFEKLKIKAENF
ncbi:MAG: carbon-nitrogen hydrolase family protein [Nitrososphaerota archaeon]|nr:carbon-nitrogen hydrolase family protein [Candidatus Bathyarchaeota archaeon]MDW8023786.1 carbon-nitrogen hydrolase family protein [Nitrososphaerota archaeon]